MCTLSASERAIYHRDKVLLKRNLFSKSELSNLLQWTDEIQDWPETPRKWMQYFQDIGEFRLLSRTENILPYHPPLLSLFLEKVFPAAKEILGDEALVFKDKLIYKFPGAQGFSTHQDIAGYVAFEKHPHLVVLIAIDEADEANGCLQVIKGYPEAKSIDDVPPEIDREQLKEWDETGKWESMHVQPGDVIFFGMHVPHRSAPNNDPNKRSRRSFYLTLNRKTEGDFREEYFRRKALADPPDIMQKYTTRKPIKKGP